MPPTILEVIRDEDGRYIGASAEALDALGYTLEELRAARPGSLGGTADAIERRIWQALIAGELQLPRYGEWYAKNGDRHAIEYRGFEAGRAAGTWVTRACLVSRRRIALNRPWMLGFILEQWRRAERTLDGLEPGDPRRPDAEEDLEELRTIYRLEADRLTREAQARAGTSLAARPATDGSRARSNAW